MFIPSWYSNVRNKVHGSFFKEQALELQKAGVKVTVAYNEVWPLTMLGKIHEEKGLKYNVEDGLKTYRYNSCSVFSMGRNKCCLYSRKI